MVFKALAFCFLGNNFAFLKGTTLGIVNYLNVGSIFCLSCVPLANSRKFCKCLLNWIEFIPIIA